MWRVALWIRRWRGALVVVGVGDSATARGIAGPPFLPLPVSCLHPLAQHTAFGDPETVPTVKKRRSLRTLGRWAVTTPCFESAFAARLKAQAYGLALTCGASLGRGARRLSRNFADWLRAGNAGEMRLPRARCRWRADPARIFLRRVCARRRRDHMAVHNPSGAIAATRVLTTTTRSSWKTASVGSVAAVELGCCYMDPVVRRHWPLSRTRPQRARRGLGWFEEDTNLLHSAPRIVSSVRHAFWRSTWADARSTRIDAAAAPAVSMRALRMPLSPRASWMRDAVFPT